MIASRLMVSEYVTTGLTLYCAVPVVLLYGSAAGTGVHLAGRRRRWNCRINLTDHSWCVTAPMTDTFWVWASDHRESFITLASSTTKVSTLHAIQSDFVQTDAALSSELVIVPWLSLYCLSLALYLQWFNGCQVCRCSGVTQRVTAQAYKAYNTNYHWLWILCVKPLSGGIVCLTLTFPTPDNYPLTVH